MKQSILRNLFVSFLGFGLLMGMVFPIYAGFFVDWRPGMKGWFILGCLVAGITIGVANFLLCRRILLRPLGRVAELAEAISRHDVTRRCDIRSHDMLGSMVSSFNRMADNLQQMLEQIGSCSNDLDRHSQSLSQLAEANEADAGRQQETGERVAENLEQVSDSAHRIAAMAGQVSEAARDTNRMSQGGALIASEAIGAITSLCSELESTADSIRNLEQKSESIGVVMEVIRGIADQTNLLALNAAIEAARAGEQGRGFAVVADEVRTLATRTQKSTEEIEKIIQELQQGSAAAVTSMQRARSRAGGTEESFEKATELLAEIAGAIHKVDEMNREVADSAASQESALQGLSENLQLIRDLGEHYATRAGESCVATGQLRGNALDLKRLTADFVTR